MKYFFKSIIIFTIASCTLQSHAIHGQSLDTDSLKHNRFIDDMLFFYKSYTDSKFFEQNYDKAYERLGKYIPKNGPIKRLDISNHFENNQYIKEILDKVNKRAYENFKIQGAATVSIFEEYKKKYPKIEYGDKLDNLASSILEMNSLKEKLIVGDSLVFFEKRNYEGTEQEQFIQLMKTGASLINQSKVMNHNYESMEEALWNVFNGCVREETKKRIDTYRELYGTREKYKSIAEIIVQDGGCSFLGINFKLEQPLKKWINELNKTFNRDKLDQEKTKKNVELNELFDQLKKIIYENEIDKFGKTDIPLKEFNPYTLITQDVTLNDFNSLTSDGNLSPVGSSYNFSGLSESAVIDGTATFIAQRFKSELKTFFFQKFKEVFYSHENEKYKTLFPNTESFLVDADISRIDQFFNFLKVSFEKDIRNMIYKVPDLVTMEILKNHTPPPCSRQSEYPRGRRISLYVEAV